MCRCRVSSWSGLRERGSETLVTSCRGRPSLLEDTPGARRDVYTNRGLSAGSVGRGVEDSDREESDLITLPTWP